MMPGPQATATAIAATAKPEPWLIEYLATNHYALAIGLILTAVGGLAVIVQVVRAVVGFVRTTIHRGIVVSIRRTRRQALVSFYQCALDTHIFIGRLFIYTTTITISFLYAAIFSMTALALKLTATRPAFSVTLAFPSFIYHDWLIRWSCIVIGMLSFLRGFYSLAYTFRMILFVLRLRLRDIRIQRHQLRAARRPSDR